MDFLEKLLDFLQQPSSYPHHPKEIEIKQTHASILAIASPYVYKIKKRVDLGFLNFTSLDKRKANCERELFLNSRLCSELYVGVLPISLKEDNLSFGQDGEIIEYALQMKKLPDGYFLNQLIQTSNIAPQGLDPLLRQLAKFYTNQSVNASIEQYGEIKQLKNNTDENFTSLHNHLGEVIPLPALEVIEPITNNFYIRHEVLLNKRVKEHKIKDCHGDLHLEHIHIYQKKICIYDCVEFNDRFRYIDIASDIAFLAMDLDFYDRPDLSVYVVNTMAELLNDWDLKPLMDFYKCYRACVRAKVECIKSSEQEVSEAESEQSRENAIQYTRLALRYATIGSLPTVIIVCGRIGSGKSTLAKAIADLTGSYYLSSDKLRKEKAGLPIFERTGAEKRNWLYSAEKTSEVYQHLLTTSLTQINNSFSVVVDATFSQASHRTMFVKVLEIQNIPYYFIEAQASDEVIVERLKRRDQTKEVISDARLEDFEKLAQAYAPIREVPSNHLAVISTEKSLDHTLTQVLLKITQLTQSNNNA